MANYTNNSGADWEKIEFDYRAGFLSVREIASSSGVSHVAISKKAKKEGWVRDLSAKIKAKADLLVTKSEVTSKVTKVTTAKENEIIEANAKVIADIRLSHRSDISRAKTLMLKLLEELESQTADRELYENLGEIMRRENDKGVDKLNDLYKKVVGSPQRIDSMKKIAETLRYLIALERQAFGIPDDASKIELTGANGQPLNSEKMSAEEAYKALLNK